MKQVIIATMLVSTGAMAQSAYEIPSIEQMASQPILSRGAVVLPVAPISRTGPTTVFQAGQFTYINQPDGRQNMCQTIGQFSYCN